MATETENVEIDKDFVNYYLTQGIIDEETLTNFQKVHSTLSPFSFWLNDLVEPYWLELLQNALEEDFFDLQELKPTSLSLPCNELFFIFC